MEERRVGKGQLRTNHNTQQPLLASKKGPISPTGQELTQGRSISMEAARPYWAPELASWAKFSITFSFCSPGWPEEMEEICNLCSPPSGPRGVFTHETEHSLKL